MTRPTKPVIENLRRLAEEQPAIVAHRGASDSHPENTLPAFARALEVGAAIVEFDVRQTAKGDLVCIHDATVDRTTDGEKVLDRKEVRVSDLDLAQLQRLDAGSWKGKAFAGARIPTLEQGLRVIANGAVPMIEHKDGDAERYVEIIRRLDLVDEVLVQSFDWEFVAAVHRLEPRIALGALGPNDDARTLTPKVLDRIAEIGAQLVHWGERDLMVEDVEELHGRGWLVCTYTTNDDAGLIGLSVMGVDAITTNRPARLRELIRRGVAIRR